MSGIDWSKKDLGWVPMVEIDSIETIEVFLTIWNLTWRENPWRATDFGKCAQGAI